MNEIEHYRPQPNYDQMMMIADKVCRTELVPSAFRGKADATLAAILYGQDLGLGPMTALNSIDIIKGKASLSAEAMRALVQKAGHKIETEFSDQGATVTITRTDGTVHTASFGPDDARRIGMSGAETYKKNPASMYLARATTAVCRAGAADVLKGLSYSAEDIDSFIPDPPIVAVHEDPNTHAVWVETTTPVRDALLEEAAQATPRERELLKKYREDNELPAATQLDEDQAQRVLDYLYSLDSSAEEEPEVEDAEIVYAPDDSARPFDEVEVQTELL